MTEPDSETEASIMQDSQTEAKEVKEAKEAKEAKEPKLRILEVDRKIAAQLYDMWNDMKLYILKEQMAKTHTVVSSPLSPSAPLNTASAHNHS